MSPTMAEVAERAGVSKSTVSLVLNDRPSVSPELREAVLHAVDELGYRLPARRSPRRAAGNKSIVVVHYELGNSEPQATPIFVDYVAGIQSFARDKGINLTFITDYREERSPLGFQLLDRGHLSVDGALLMGWGARRDGRLLHQFLDQGVPVVALSRNWPDLPISTVGQDHHQQARIALEHLMGLGHRAIAFLASKHNRHHEWFDWRLECYRQAMLHLNDQVDEELIAIGKDGYQAAQALMTRRPDVTAIFAIEDQNAVQAMCGLRDMELDIPRNVSVIGLDDTIKPGSDCPALTTVAFPHFEVGFLATELLLKQIENDDLYYSSIIVRSRLIERDSCAAPRS